MIHVKLSASTRESQLVLRQISICHLNVNISQLSLINHSCYCKAQQEASHNRAQVFISAKRMHVTVNSKTSMGIKRLRLYLYSSRYIWKQFFFLWPSAYTETVCLTKTKLIKDALPKWCIWKHQKYSKMTTHVKSCDTCCTNIHCPTKKKKKI